MQIKHVYHTMQTRQSTIKELNTRFTHIQNIYYINANKRKHKITHKTHNLYIYNRCNTQMETKTKSKMTIKIHDMCVHAACIT